MNSKAIHIEQYANTDIDQLVSRPASVITAICEKVSGFLVRSEQHRAQAEYRAKQQRQARIEAHQDAFLGLSLEEKLRHGMYRWMD